MAALSRDDFEGLARRCEALRAPDPTLALDVAAPFQDACGADAAALVRRAVVEFDAKAARELVIKHLRPWRLYRVREDKDAGDRPDYTASLVPTQGWRYYKRAQASELIEGKAYYRATAILAAAIRALAMLEASAPQSSA
jgi:hypothetical protein